MSVSELPPGPKGLPFIGCLFDFSKDALGFLKRSADEYGDIVYYKVGPRKIYLLNNPENIKEVLVTHNSNFLKKPGS